MYTTLKFIGTPLVSVTETPLRVYWDTLRGSLTTIVDNLGCLIKNLFLTVYVFVLASSCMYLIL